MFNSTWDWRKKPIEIPNTGNLRTPLEEVYDTIIDNLNVMGKIIPEEIDTFRAMLKVMEPQQLVETLLDTTRERLYLEARKN